MLNLLSNLRTDVEVEDPFTSWNQEYFTPRSLVALQSNMTELFTEVVKSLGRFTKLGSSAS